MADIRCQALFPTGVRCQSLADVEVSADDHEFSLCEACAEILLAHEPLPVVVNVAGTVYFDRPSFS